MLCQDNIEPTSSLKEKEVHLREGEGNLQAIVQKASFLPFHKDVWSGGLR